MRTATRRTAEGLALVGGVMMLRPGTQANKVMCRAIDAAGRRLRYAGGRAQGVSYHLSGRRPDPGVDDLTMADRIRSSLGGLERELDLPHVHVMVEGGMALLHGEVDSEGDARRIEEAVAAVSGVEGVESYLHIGLGLGDTRPSEGRAVRVPSPAMRRILDAAVGAGIEPQVARRVVRAVLATFADRLPEESRERLAAHLPADVRALFTPPPRSGREAHPRRIADLVARIAVGAGDGIPPAIAEPVTAAVIEELRSLVPEEARDVAAVLPAELRHLWQGQTVG